MREQDEARSSWRAGLLSTCILGLALCGGAAAEEGEAPTHEDLVRRVEELERQLAASEEATSPGAGEGDPAADPEADALARVLDLAQAVRFSLIAYGSYAYNFNRPSDRLGVNLYRAFDRDHDTFVPDLCRLSLYRPLERDGWDVGFQVDLAFGRTADLMDLDPNFGDPADAVELMQAWVGLRLPAPLGPVDVKLGKAVAWIGAEVHESPLNYNVSRSLLFNLGGPFNHTGASVSWAPYPGVSYTQWLVNGWDNAVDNNDAKSLGGQLAFSSESVSLFCNWIAGPEQDDDVSHQRLVLDSVLQLRTPWAEGYFEALYGRESFSLGGDGEWGGLATAVKVPLWEDHLFLAGRAEWFRDLRGSRTGSGVEQELLEATLTLGVRVLEYVLIRVEARYDHSLRGPGLFPGPRADSGKVDQTTIGAELAFQY